MTNRYEVERDEKWRDWCGGVMPFLEFPAGFQIQVIPPFGGAMARFCVRKIGSDEHVSVYFDVNDSLGYMGKPYWEIYPYGDDTARFLLGDEHDMVAAICRQIDGLVKREIES